MGVEIDPINGDYTLNGYNVTHILQTFAADQKIELPPIEKVLSEKAGTINEKMVASAQQRHVRWQKNMQRLREKQDISTEFKRKQNLRENDDEESTEQRKIAIFQQKQTQESDIHEERYQTRKKEAEEQKITSAEEAVARRKKAKKIRIERHKEIAEQRKTKEPPPTERREQHVAYKEALVEKAHAETNISREALAEHREQLSEKRQEKIEHFSKETRERLAYAETLAAQAQERADYNASLRTPPEEQVLTDRERLADIHARGHKVREYKFSLAEKHFENLKQRIVDIFEDSGKKREEAVAVLDDIIERGREMRSNTRIASGNPLGQREVMNDIDFFELMRSRIHDIMERSAARRKEAVEYKKLLTENARERRDDHMALSGNPKEDLKNMSALAFYLKRKNRELFTIISKAQERSLYRSSITGMPKENRQKLHKTYYRIIALMHNPLLISSTEADMSIGLTRKNPEFLVRRIVEDVIAYYESHSFIHLLAQAKEEREERDIIAQSMPEHSGRMVPKPYTPEKAQEEINLVLRQENFKALLSGLLIDDTLQTDVILKPDNSKQENDTLSYFAHIVNMLDETEEPTDEPSRKKPSDDIFTLIEGPSHIFDELGKSIDKELKREIVDNETVFMPTPEEELRKEDEKHIAEYAEYRKEKDLREKAKEHHAEFIRAIEEQNKTAQEKAIDESNMIDFFF